MFRPVWWSNCLWLLLLAIILMLEAEFVQGLKCYHEEMKLDGVLEDSVLNFALRKTFDAHTLTNQSATVQKCPHAKKEKAYCAKTSCEFGNGIYADFKSCMYSTEMAKYNHTMAECATSNMGKSKATGISDTTKSNATAEECMKTALLHKSCTREFCTTDLCNGGSAVMQAAVSILLLFVPAVSTVIPRFA